MIERYFRGGVRLRWAVQPNGTGWKDGKIINSTGLTNPMIYDGLDGHQAVMDPMLMVVNVYDVLGLRMRDTIPYQWLDYTPGSTARIAMTGTDIVTGRMSGCLIARGTYNGQMSVFHVGTDSNDRAATKLVKEKFRDELPMDATGFDPFNSFTPYEIALAGSKLGERSEVYALVTTGGEFYTVVMTPVREEVKGTGGVLSYKDADGQNYMCINMKKLVTPLNRAELLDKLA